MGREVSLSKSLFRIVPLSFCVGAGIELFMTYVRVGSETFYETAKRLEAERREARRQSQKELEERVKSRKTAS